MELAGDRGKTPHPGLCLVAPADAALGESLKKNLCARAPLLTRPRRHDLERVVEGVGVPQRCHLRQRLQAQLVVAVALHAGQQEAAA